MKLSRSRMTLVLRLMVTTVLAASAILVPTGIARAADTETPILTSFSVSETQVTPGQKVIFSYVATDGADSLKGLRLGYLDSHAHIDVLTPESPFPIAGSVIATIPDNWWNGSHSLSWVQLTDPGGNSIYYYRNGSVYISPGATGPASHTLSLAPNDLTVSASNYEMTAPVLTSVSASGGPARPGETIKIDYEATDDSGSLKSVSLLFLDANHVGRFIDAPVADGLPLNGSVDQVIPATWPNGAYALLRVTLTDHYLNQSIYRSDGTVLIQPTGAQGPASHTVDFGPATFAVTDSTADFTPPVLISLQLTGSPVAPGGTATLSYTAESQDPLTYVSFTYADALGKSLVFTTSTPQLTGALSATVPAGRPLGKYILKGVELRDSTGNSILYRADGTTTRNPGSFAGTHAIVMSTMALTVGYLPPTTLIYGVTVRSGSAIVIFGTGYEPTSLTQFKVTAQPGGRTITTNGQATQAEVTGLTNGTTYRFTVTASNALGDGPASLLSAPVTPKMTSHIIGAGNFSGEGGNDLIGLRSPTGGTYLMQPSYLYRGNGTGGFSGSTSMNHEFSNLDRIVFSSGDFDGNGAPDVMTVVDGGFNSLYLEPGNGHGGFTGARTYIGSGWGVMRTVFGPGDFSGDRKSDILAINGAGDLYLYRGNGIGGIAGVGQRIGAAWGSFQTVFSLGDFTGDGKSDIMGVSKDGGLYLYRGNGLGGFTGPGQKIGTGWGTFLTVFSPGDFTGDRKSDVMAVNPAGDLVLYRGNGLGGWASGGLRIGSGWSIFR